MAQSQDPSRIRNYRNEHKVSSKNPEQFVILETITIEVVGDGPTPPQPPPSPVAPLSVPKVATPRGLEVDTDYASTEFDSKGGSRSNSDSNTESTEAEDFREGNYLDDGCRPSRFAEAREGVNVAVATQLTEYIDTLLSCRADDDHDE